MPQTGDVVYTKKDEPSGSSHEELKFWVRIAAIPFLTVGVALTAGAAIRAFLWASGLG